MVQRACTNTKRVVADEWSKPDDFAVFWEDQNNEMNSLVKVPADCLGIRFIVDVVPSTLLKTKPVSNMYHKTFIQANNTNACIQTHINIQMHKHSGVYHRSKYMVLTVITGSEITLHFFNFIEP